jgi:hypothetical protein
MSNKIRKTVSFNVTNEEDRKYLERIENVNFSGYVKRLIEKDIKSRRIIKSETEVSRDGSASLIITKGTNLVMK